jgi:hypothetical protein
VLVGGDWLRCRVGRVPLTSTSESVLTVSNHSDKDMGRIKRFEKERD